MDDKILNACLSAAKSSSCKKIGFGCVAVVEGNIVHIENNAPLETTKFMCDGKCVRGQIPSRTHSMIGACAHAEERTLVHIAEQYSHDVFRRLKLYIAGVQKDEGVYKALAKTISDFSCIRCATQFALYNIPGVHIYRTDLREWRFIPAEVAIQTAYKYATGALMVERELV